MTSIRYFILSIALTVTALAASAFPVESYAPQSALASGRWTKVSVSSSGMHFIPASTLRSWGFKDVAKVRIHGYGGQQIPDLLSKANYVDDLPEVATHRSAAGIWFYATGPVKWTAYSGGRYTQSLNPFSTEGYYYLTEDSQSPIAIERQGSTAAGSTPVESFQERLYHEIDQATVSHSGYQLLGEDFRTKRQQTFSFPLTDRVDIDNNPVWSRVTFVTNTTSTSQLEIAANGTRLSTRSLGAADGDANYGVRGNYSFSFSPESQNVDMTLTFTPTGTVSAAHLDGITINYQRALRLASGTLDFSLNSTSARLQGSSPTTHVWDVTNHIKPFELETTISGSSLTWVNPYTGLRNYAAWDESAKLPAPKLVGSVANQNIHGITECPDMIIITVKDFAGEAERVAALHRRQPDNFNVLVLTQDDIFNEFSSGTKDVGAFRRVLKMFYDRGIEAGHPLRYCLLFGRPTFDIRKMTAEMKAVNEPLMPAWQTDESLQIASTFTSDDVLAMLDDNSGAIPAYSRLSIAIGRIPARNLSQAKGYVDKLYTYTDNSLRSEWKNSIILEADNGNNGAFMVGPTNGRTTGMEGFYNGMMSDPYASQMRFNKIYYDAFQLQNSACPRAEELFNLALKEGSILWLYNGHGSQTGLGGEGLHSITKIDRMANKHWPVMIAITCSFGQWDSPAACGIENLSFNPIGGAIAAIAPSRKAFISENDGVLQALGSTMLRRNDDGSPLRLGDMIINAKNQLITSAQSGAALTKLRLMTLGDPAMRIVIPQYSITLDEVDGFEVTPENQTTIMARQRLTLKGTVRDANLNPVDDFNGSVTLTIYDAETTTTTKGTRVDGTDGKAINFDEMGSKLYSGRAAVERGQFSIDIAMPSEVADNFRPATVSMYATAPDGLEAMGVNRDIFVYGYDDTADPDTIPPTINSAYLNHESFTNGSIVNEQPMFIADLSDDIGINLSMAGIGHQMTLKLDDNRTFSDVALYFTPSPDGSPAGTIAYPLSDLAEGNHSLTLRVWDTSGNSASRRIDFFVENGALPQVFDIYTDCNPATTHANFYISHNRPDATATVKLDIYNIAGRRVWSSIVSGQSDMFLSTPIQWNLTDQGGQRVARGIYIYRAVIEIDGHEIPTPARRIAVTGH